MLGRHSLTEPHQTLVMQPSPFKEQPPCPCPCVPLHSSPLQGWVPECSTALQNTVASPLPLLFQTADSCRHRGSAEILMRREVSVVLIFFRPVTWSIEQLPDLPRATQQLGGKKKKGIKSRSGGCAQNSPPLGACGSLQFKCRSNC